MDKTLILGMVSSPVAIVAAVIAVWGQLPVKRVGVQLALQKAKADRRAETEQTASRFREPLGRAPYELQSRIFNIVDGGFFTRYLEGGDGRTRSYAINHTLFVTAQYFAWTELIAERFILSMGADEETPTRSASTQDLFRLANRQIRATSSRVWG